MHIHSQDIPEWRRLDIVQAIGDGREYDIYIANLSNEMSLLGYHLAWPFRFPE